MEGEPRGCGAVTETASHDLLMADSNGGADAWTGVLVTAVRKCAKLIRNGSSNSLS